MSALRYTDYGMTVGEPPDEYRPYYGYNGEEHDPLTGLQYLRARYYDAAVGAFTSRDPYEGAADVPLSQNGFTYAHNNPVNYADPSGMVITGGTVKLMNDGGGSSRRPVTGAASATVNAAAAALKRAQSMITGGAAFCEQTWQNASLCICFISYFQNPARLQDKRAGLFAWGEFSPVGVGLCRCCSVNHLPTP